MIFHNFFITCSQIFLNLCRTCSNFFLIFSQLVQNLLGLVYNIFDFFFKNLFLTFWGLVHLRSTTLCHVPNLFTTSSWLLSYMFMTCRQLVHVLWRSCSRLLHHHFPQPSYDLFCTCSRLVHITYSQILLNLFMTSSQLVKNISISFSLISRYSWAWNAASV